MRPEPPTIPSPIAARRRPHGIEGAATTRMRVAGALACAALAGCAGGGPGAERRPNELVEIDPAELNEVMLAVAEPGEAVAHFRRTAEARPGDAATRRGLATSLMRADRPEEAAPVWRALAEGPGGTPEDGVALAEALIRTGDWAGARAALGAVPPTHETARRYRLEAMVADAGEDWARADAFYEIAAELATAPAGVLNNWGFSKLSRGDPEGAERLFARALDADPTLFTAKNNLALARGARGLYEVPLVPMTQAERATLLHTLALSAIRSGDVAIGRTLLRDAVETHPQHFDAAARALAALEGGTAL